MHIMYDHDLRNSSNEQQICDHYYFLRQACKSRGESLDLVAVSVDKQA